MVGERGGAKKDEVKVKTPGDRMAVKGGHGEKGEP